jgi:succinate dehydrogenase/fumarate reductase flavoprotein subunit
MFPKKLSGWLLSLILILAAALAITCASGAVSASGSRAKSGSFLNMISWDAEYDVVVAGYGGAGATAAVTAADAGAKVLLLEKGPLGHEGGNTRYALQLVMVPKEGERANAITYYKAMRGDYNNQSDEMIEYIVDGAMANKDWLINMGVPADKLKPYPLVEFPELPGGNEAVTTLYIEPLRWNSTLFKFLHSLVDARLNRIDVWFESPAVKLIQDPETKIIHGVVVERGGQSYNIRAKNGVVLATGGFENNDVMLENYAQLGDAYSKAARYNTGDGITMAMEIGADLWHMSTLAGPDVNFINPRSGIAQNYYFTTGAAALNFPGFGSTSMIVVGGNGRRFMNETVAPRHGHVETAGTWFSLLVPRNSWCIFDENARLSSRPYKEWSEGVEEEIANGWVIKADNLQELAQKTGINLAGLQDEINIYNGYCRAGNDPQYHVNSQYLKPLSAQGPYYGFPVKASLTNTQGGPRRNTNCEVLDARGNPIPHLYSAGELGSFYTDIYNGGGNLSECLFTGRTAGTNAAQAKNDVPSSSVLSANKVDFRFETLDAFIARNESSLGPNEYIGVGSGMGGDLVVKVAASGSDITGITFLRINETLGVCDRAIAQVPKAIIDRDTPDVDAVAGATLTSEAIIAAVKDALSKAK